MKPWFFGGLAVSLLLVSCAAKSAPTRITVQVPENFAGPLRLYPCDKNSLDPVLVNENGEGKTSACPTGDDVEIVVLKSGKSIYIAPEKIKVARAGDGFPVSISAAIP
ncbi:MAG: hypothetical protein ABSB66_13600 [Candidatus Acidiferrales bacterium]|jgi:hypothetical protein